MSGHRRSAAIVLAAATILGITACTTTSGGPAQVSRVPPSTLVDPTQGLTVPLTADGGALVVTEGEPPSDVTKERALSRFHELRSPATQPTVIGVVSGLVSLRPGLGHDLVAYRPAWVIAYTETTVSSCLVETMPTTPPDASNLRAVVIMGEQPLAGTTGGPTIAPIFGYDGAGTDICGPSTEPGVLTVDQLLHGQG
jgi:hypothetical protein